MTASYYVERIRNGDRNLFYVGLGTTHLCDSEMDKLLDCLLEHPNAIRHLFVHDNHLSDAISEKLARFVASSNTIVALYLSNNELGTKTFLDLAGALCVNTSLRFLQLYGNHKINKECIDTAFLRTLRINPVHSYASTWLLYDIDNAIRYLRPVAEEMGHPTLQELLLGLYLPTPRVLAKRRDCAE